MSWADWLFLFDAAALAGYCVVVVWAGCRAADELRKRPAVAVRRHPGHYGERAE